MRAAFTVFKLMLSIILWVLRVEMSGVALREKIQAGGMQEIVDVWLSSLRLPHKWRWLANSLVLMLYRSRVLR